MSHNMFFPSNLILIKYKIFSKLVFIEMYIGKMHSRHLNCFKLIIIFQNTHLLKNGHKYVETSASKHFK